MRSIRVAPVALLGAAALVLTAPAAYAYAAASGGVSPATGFTVTPSVNPPGSQVALAARGCPTTATAGSGVLDTVTVARGGYVASTVGRDARPGDSVDRMSTATTAVGAAPAVTAVAGAVLMARHREENRPH
ncbi:hypothetical protein AB0467_11690 [Streptomyces sp. NPDC052095]|uniref:hypothetical protein n=1 Tax=unclassified Streptomyces TaxID=2593676 RepID=UPI00344E1571